MQDCFWRRKIDTPSLSFTAPKPFGGILSRRGAERSETQKSISHSLTRDAFLVIFMFAQRSHVCFSPLLYKRAFFHYLVLRTYLALSIYSQMYDDGMNIDFSSSFIIT